METYVTDYMIDNIILLITGTLHQRPITELISKCHPLGSFDQMEAINIASTPAELYNAVIVDTPLGKFSVEYAVADWPSWRVGDRQPVAANRKYKFLNLELEDNFLTYWLIKAFSHDP